MYGLVQYSTVQYSTVQCSTSQYITVQYSTVQYSTVQHNTAQLKNHGLNAFLVVNMIFVTTICQNHGSQLCTVSHSASELQPKRVRTEAMMYSRKY